MRILLVRHGESEANVDPGVHATTADHAIELSARGREQAREAGRRVRAFYQQVLPIGPVRLWVSPYARTRQTAQLLREEAGDVLTDQKEHVLLCEQQFGLFDGIPDEELARRFPAEHAHYAKCEQFEGRFWARMPLGESRFDVAVRVHQAFGTFHRDREKHGIRELVVVCHGVTLRAFVMMWCHRDPEWFEAEPNPSNCAIRLIEDGKDRGYLFEGFARTPAPVA